MRRRNRYLLIIGIVVVVLIGARVALEPILLDYVNDRFEALQAYDGHVEDLENREKDQVAARIPLSGTIENPDADLFATIGSVLRNGFVSAFARSLEGSISVRSVRESLKDVSEKDDRDAKNDEKKKRKG